MQFRNMLVLALAASVIASPTKRDDKDDGDKKHKTDKNEGSYYKVEDGGKTAHKSAGAKVTKTAKHHGSSKTSAPHAPAKSGGAGGSYVPPGGSYNLPGGDGGSTNGTTGGGGSYSGGLQTTFPTPKGSQNLAAVKTIGPGEKFDGGMQLWDRSPSTCKGQSEGGNKDAVFILQEGATLSNVVIGPNNGEGIHCLGSCTLNNVWFQKVCEDAITFKQTSGTSFVNGGGAQDAEDKVLQHNGGGTVHVKDFYCKNCSKMYRSCGNCKTQTARKSIFENCKLDGGKVLAGVNGNNGDTAEIKNSCVVGAEVCENFEGNSSGKEPSLVGKGPDGKSCVATGVKSSC
ncbi:putative pectate lyase D [Colletotrichum spinosum]|uniref:Pectate lyase n=1 Tax=Colletotrichum spinosum TaxID=1347390 RepID=A0A4R8PYK9_9PEZI|nr:putative pectate lyase D [Colletotrichum spinosum]